jgi:hypothetical protein
MKIELKLAEKKPGLRPGLVNGIFKRIGVWLKLSILDS